MRFACAREGHGPPANLGVRRRACAHLHQERNDEWRAGSGLPFGLDLKALVCVVARPCKARALLQAERLAAKCFQTQRDPQSNLNRPYCFDSCLRPLDGRKGRKNHKTCKDVCRFFYALPNRATSARAHNAYAKTLHNKQHYFASSPEPETTL